MKIILLKDVKAIGKKFEEKVVADGYAFNYLLPRQLALIADKSGIAKAKQMKEVSEAKQANEAKKLEEKEIKRREKHEALEKFKSSLAGSKLEQRESSSPS